MQSAVIFLQILTPKTTQLSETLGDDLEVRKGLVQSGGIQWLVSGLSQRRQHQYLLALVLQILFQLRRQLRCCHRFLISDQALVSRKAAP